MQTINQFVNVTEAQIAELLGQLGFMKVDLDMTAEVVFSRKITYEDAPTIVRIYTGVLKSTGMSRPAGKDAIRVCLGRMIDGKVKIFKALPIVRRTGAWREHLIERLSGIGDGIAAAPALLTEEDILQGRRPGEHRGARPPCAHRACLSCPLCNSEMVGPKPSRYGAFFGCSRFPKCRGSRNADGSARPS